MLSYWRATDFPFGSEARLRQKGNSIYHQQLLTMEDRVICAKGNATCSFNLTLDHLPTSKQPGNLQQLLLLNSLEVKMS